MKWQTFLLEKFEGDEKEKVPRLDPGVCGRSYGPEQPGGVRRFRQFCMIVEKTLPSNSYGLHNRFLLRERFS